jgi:hypothetical protein
MIDFSKESPYHLTCKTILVVPEGHERSVVHWRIVVNFGSQALMGGIARHVKVYDGFWFSRYFRDENKVAVLALDSKFLCGIVDFVRVCRKSAGNHYKLKVATITSSRSQ